MRGAHSRAATSRSTSSSVKGVNTMKRFGFPLMVILGASVMAPAPVAAQDAAGVTGAAEATFPDGATFNGTATVDMGDGTLPLPAVPFTVTISAGSLALILNAVALPTATLSAGSITVK